VRSPQFWWRDPGPASALLSPAGALYGAIAAVRLRRVGAKASVPVICIGNLIIGGAGKTPLAIAVASCLHDLGRRPVFLTRGYRGRLHGPVHVDPQRHDFRDVGDEALLLARLHPTIVAGDRAKGARLAARYGDVIVMDDGFQNPGLRKDLSILAIDAEQGIGNRCVFPAGPLRAPLAAQLPLADALVVIGEGMRETDADEMGLPQLRAAFRPSEEALQRLAGRPVFAYCGIGRPEKFLATLAAAGARAMGSRAFADHHRFTDAEAEAIHNAAAEVGALPVTTAKDAVRLVGSPALQGLAAASLVVDGKLVVADEAALRRLLDGVLND
jgi:tetraacyldisaccharide 4'-kinase